MRSPRPSTARRTRWAVVSSRCSGWYPTGMNRVTMGPKAQMPRLVFTSAPRDGQPPPGEGVHGHRGQQDDAGDEELHAGAVVQQAHTVRDAVDDERPEECARDPPAAAEEAGAAD